MAIYGRVKDATTNDNADSWFIWGPTDWSAVIKTTEVNWLKVRSNKNYNQQKQND